MLAEPIVPDAHPVLVALALDRRADGGAPSAARRTRALAACVHDGSARIAMRDPRHVRRFRTCTSE